ncbi:nitroreductase family deazaflavin-dependent oxidoreductase [Luteimicrobium subarcticum]|uniref:Deazaflavin-dependent oxidoreductase (Nitroreductase family) n=1 Tax=Luteimicrobium subarcticum TaxID=620910 RepID=A0A2M8WU42_9MICO|nr:nitroreductase family deazaflavin-dependent oxidoreductase [Luteimicrobium subarcticum]PJI94467.1 hypothetical protein CLV34_0303 [Luteimicrobium subarcticum]
MPLPQSIPQAAKRFNPHVLALARHRPPFAVVYHEGRTTGRRYRTPVIVFARPRDDGEVDALFALPYGPRVDWVRNGEAAGRLLLERADVVYVLDDLRTQHGDEAMAQVPDPARTFLTTLGTRDVLLARVRHLVEPPADPRPGAVGPEEDQTISADSA